MINNLDNLYSNFDRSINWNAYLYIIQKIVMTILTFIFFKKLSSQDFSTWANINSIIFLILLWIDFGFRKSVPKYIPEFAKNRKSHLSFTKFIIKFQSIALIITSIFLIFTLKHITNFIGIELTHEITIFTILMFLLEGPIALLKLIYHAHFWNKHFNLIYGIIIMLEAITYFFILFFFKAITLTNIFLIKILSSTSIIIITGLWLIKLYLKEEYNQIGSEINFEITKKSFLKHSGIMWGNTALRSFGERNFLIPMLTFSLGTELANIFKISNDWALLFQRGILKTIGTTDTSLFSHMHLIQKNLMQDAFTKIISKIIHVCIPLFGVFIILILNKNYFMGNNHMIFPIFIILVILYTVESILSPFERILEINKKYFILILSYLPYLFFIYLVFGKYFLPSIGFETFIFVLCFIKLISALTLTFYSKRIYKIKISLKEIKIL